MKKYLIGSIVGGIIIFIWQSLSFAVLGIHNNSMKYTAAQDEIKSVLASKLTEDGAYMVPSAPTQKEREDLFKKMDGQPMAEIIFQKSVDTDMTMRFIRTFLVNVFLVISLIYMLTRGGTPIGRRVFSASVAFGLAAWLWSMYIAHIWAGLPWHMIGGDLIDAIAAWGLVGLWLGWWLNRASNKI